ncbi:hypothetical protein NMY22_g3342 [Coprinellus aureogranulatus]|nr:hypothetical protein NMY22_g3342 [Coprinellus aureogranulatus]
MPSIVSVLPLSVPSHSLRPPGPSFFPPSVEGADTSTPARNFAASRARLFRSAVSSEPLRLLLSLILLPVLLHARLYRERAYTTGRTWLSESQLGSSIHLQITWRKGNGYSGDTASGA